MDSFLTRSAKKLEQALGVPRPWELTPATSVGYQMATGEGPIGERARKGTAQFIGRYATNIKEPWGYEVRNIKPPIESLKAVIKDQPAYEDSLSHLWHPHRTAREILYREMFDLPSRSESSALEKIGPKEYALKNFYQPEPEPLPFPQPHVVNNMLMQNVMLTPTETGSYKYADVWDIVSPSDTERKDIATKLRNIVAPILRPATITGEVPAR
jgi:hypothetical protein